MYIGTIKWDYGAFVWPSFEPTLFSRIFTPNECVNFTAQLSPAYSSTGSGYLSKSSPLAVAGLYYSIVVSLQLGPTVYHKHFIDH